MKLFKTWIDTGIKTGYSTGWSIAPDVSLFFLVCNLLKQEFCNKTIYPCIHESIWIINNGDKRIALAFLQMSAHLLDSTVRFFSPKMTQVVSDILHYYGTPEFAHIYIITSR